MKAGVSLGKLVAMVVDFVFYVRGIEFESQKSGLVLMTGPRFTAKELND